MLHKSIYDFFTAPVVLISKKQASCFISTPTQKGKMIMNLRRLTAFLLAAVSLLVLTACGAPADSAPAQEDTQQSAAAESQTAPEGGEWLKFLKEEKFILKLEQLFFLQLKISS